MPVPLGVSRSVDIATYLKTRLRAELHGKVDSIRMPERWTLELLEECDFIVKEVVKAVKNQRRMKWSVEEYLQHLTKGGKKLEETLLQRFPPGETERIMAATVILDREGKILLWYLPRLLGRKRQHTIWQSVEIIERALNIKLTSSSWRVNGDYFRSAEDCTYKPGTVSFALAWFQQGMVGILDLEVAAELRKPPARAWVSAVGESSALLGGLLGIINPALFNTGISCIEAISNSGQVAKREGLEELLDVWTTPYTTASLMNNRDCPLHRDKGGNYSSMDLLTSVGPYEQANFEVPGLGYSFWYPSGTVIGLLGRVVRHGAVATGERLCWAQYLKENVLSTLGIVPPQWAYIQDLEKL